MDVVLATTTFAEEQELARFQNVEVEIRTDTLVPTEAYGAVDLGSANMFHLGLTDPSSTGEMISGDIQAVVYGSLIKANLRCSKL